MSYKILVINPGSTTTKIAVYEDENPIFSKNIEHDAEAMNTFKTIPEQAPYRAEIIQQAVEAEGISMSELSCIMGRGGMVLEPPLTTGGYLVNDDLYYALGNDELTSPHASLLGGMLGKQFADKLGIPAYIYDAVTSGDLPEVAKITGFKEITRRSMAHVLNSRAMAIKYAASQGKSYEDMNIIVAHMGGGCSLSAHQNGKIIDSFGDDDFQMSAERSGSAPLLQFTDLCFSGKYGKGDVKKLIRGKGGMYAHLGTSDGREAQKMADNGDEKAVLVQHAMAYQLAKSIGALSTTLKGKVDVIILTGGLAHSKFITDKIQEYAGFLAPIQVMAGENEMESLALGALRIMRGEEGLHEYKLAK